MNARPRISLPRGPLGEDRPVVFGADMAVESVNDGPFTVLVEV